MAGKIDPESEGQLREAWQEGAGGMASVSAQGLGNVMRYLGHNPTSAELQNMVSEFGSGGAIDCNGFMGMMGRRLKVAEGEQEVIEAFKVFDKDGTGYIASGELRHLLSNLGEGLEREEVNSMMTQVIPGAAGNLQYEPFVRHVMNA
mmetsp:Transcript_27466/g.76780  ORF Transcript_27466/g.76780 Transcript_27466/m.76780 type:complete len:147 (-) Transcript_27466:86-526(-)|eukprot:CAMPEP_0119128110 /NCGR_PEP_ID=MMETSP1310-20130426/6393_1 /TAXON_ID=464262 /ORGANISM="Genus nov. species nov., Strain RCC2339" /LENGTH=146 /DNA_ID=CAMNT_0007118417 /DNA_START=105 /DNA_END=545 /DNA_ORIENTATION=-